VSAHAERFGTVAVVGAGWAGLAAALTLAEAGAAVTLFDSAPIAGGRARTTMLDTPLGRFALDNGQHLIVGAYREALALIDELGAGGALRRHRLELTAPSGLSLRAAGLPAPLHLAWALLRAGGLSLSERGAVVRLMASLKRDRWQPPTGETVETMLGRLHQPARLAERLWAPLCIGALNTLPVFACARSFAAVLRDTLGSDRGASDFVTSEIPLGGLLPEPALARLRELGAVVRLRETARALKPGPRGWTIDTGAAAGENSEAQAPPGAGGGAFTSVLLALPPWAALRLATPLGLDVSPLRAFDAEPIATVWAFWPAEAAPMLPAWSLLDEDPARDRHGQWLFDRGTIVSNGQRAHAAGIVISVASRLATLAPDRVVAGVAAQLQDAFGGPPPSAMRLVTERRATFRCTPDRPRLEPGLFASAAPGLWLAGDWLWPDYPATLESAVRSGRQAAARILASAQDSARGRRR
jgi:squalene-associated FAD-dependent desaturase